MKEICKLLLVINNARNSLCPNTLMEGVGSPLKMKIDMARTRILSSQSDSKRAIWHQKRKTKVAYNCARVVASNSTP